MSGLSFRRKIVLDNLQLAVKHKNELTDLERRYILALHKRIINGLKPEDLSQEENNTLHIIVEGLKWKKNI